MHRIVIHRSLILLRMMSEREWMEMIALQHICRIYKQHSNDCFVQAETQHTKRRVFHHLTWYLMYLFVTPFSIR